MSEGLGYSTLLVSTAYDIQLPCHACPHIQEKRYSSDVQGKEREEKKPQKNKKKQVIFSFLFNLNS